MALPFDISLLAPLVICSGNASLQNLSFPSREVQFGKVEQVNPDTTIVEVDQYVCFYLSKADVMVYNGTDQYFLVADTDLKFIEPPPL